MPYKVLVDDLTVNRDGPEITDLFGNVIGHQTISAIYPKGHVLEDEEVGEALRESVDRGETEGYLEKVGDADLEESRKAQEPFPGYSDMSVEEVQVLFTVLPSDSIRAIVEFETNHGENRAGIADYHIGRGEAFTDRLTGRAGSPGQEGDEKPELASIITRDVTEDDVRFGESLLDDGTPQIPVGSLDGDDRHELEKLDDEPTKADAGADEPKGRRGRRATAAAAKAAAKQPAKSGGQSEGDKGDGDDGDKS